MSLIGLLIAVLITVVLVWLIQQGHIPAPFTWICYAVLVVIWLVLLIQATGLGSRFDFGARVGSLPTSSSTWVT
jgi:hypothetical protein